VGDFVDSHLTKPSRSGSSRLIPPDHSVVASNISSTDRTKNLSGSGQLPFEAKLSHRLRELAEYQRAGDQFVAVQAENAKLRKVIEEMQTKLVQAYEVHQNIESLVAEVDSSLAFEIQKVLKVPKNNEKSQHRKQ